MADMADGSEDIREDPTGERPDPANATLTPAPPTLPYASFSPMPQAPVIVRQPSALERWRVALIVAPLVLFIVFGALDLSNIFFRPPQDAGTTRPLVVNAQVVADATPAAHPDLGLAPDTLTIACGKTGALIITNKSARPLQWSVSTDSDALSFAPNMPHTSLLAPGASFTLSVMAFTQPGAYLLHISDDHGEVADVTIQVSC